MRALPVVLLVAALFGTGCWESHSRNVELSGGRFRAFDAAGAAGRPLLVDEATGDTWRLETVSGASRWVLLTRGPEDVRPLERPDLGVN